jgi:DNA-binding transcriptional ArsR family regulator
MILYFHNYGNIKYEHSKQTERLRTNHAVRRYFRSAGRRAPPSDQAELQLSASTLSHHLDKLKNEELLTVTRESTFLRYRANAEVLQEVLTFLFAECCKKNACVPADEIVRMCKC